MDKLDMPCVQVTSAQQGHRVHRPQGGLPDGDGEELKSAALSTPDHVPMRRCRSAHAAQVHWYATASAVTPAASRTSWPSVCVQALAVEFPRQRLTRQQCAFSNRQRDVAASELTVQFNEKLQTAFNEGSPGDDHVRHHQPPCLRAPPHGRCAPRRCGVPPLSSRGRTRQLQP